MFDDAGELTALRRHGNAIKARALSGLPELLKRLEHQCTRNGIRVHWAETTEDANRIVLEILRRHQATRMVKGKSMVPEEMHLNQFLAGHGIEAIETDLGEFIIQLDGETPSHIIVPAVRKNKDQIARTFHAKIPGAPYTENVAPYKFPFFIKYICGKTGSGPVAESKVLLLEPYSPFALRQ